MRAFGLYHVKTLETFLPAPGDARALLDVAGGTGWMASRFASRFQRVTVLDASEGMLRVARRRNLEAVHGSALDMPFSDAAFDVVLCTDALHHIKNAKRAVTEMARVVKPGGVVLIQEFHIRSAAGWCVEKLEHLFVDRSRFITPGELQTLMARHGLSTETRRVSWLEYVCAGRKQPKSP
ncbi:MAG: class I SAM-dependent methyltransferase [Kiritimatiellaeota bacterium]|nr:class I SAM-dependent methyltransferase [Kiritimatiellota bacterium]